ncbi:MAG: arsenate reductase ArsC [Azospirillaceae bacterium]|nr:arsenate reductase ArsC [Azospirillaceae bacterium]
MTIIRRYSVLFVCTANSIRSIFAECTLRRWGQGRFDAFSAGSQPLGVVDPMASSLLERLNYDVASENLRSKSWDEFSTPEAPVLDFVFVLDDAVFAQPLPEFPGQPVVTAWGIDDPRLHEGPEDRRMRLLKRVYLEIENRSKLFASLRMEGLSNLTLKTQLDRIGTTQAEAISPN